MQPTTTDPGPHRRARFVLTILVSALCTATLSAAADELPFGMRTSHLNIVLTASSIEATENFYGGALGLEQLETWSMSSGSTMVRFLAGESEVKVIVWPEEKQKELRTGPRGAATARGIRLLALLLPASERSAMEDRFRKLGLPPVEYTDRPSQPVPYSFGMAWDADGNQIEIVFLDESKASPTTFKQAQIGLAVSDGKAMSTFLTDVLGLPLESANASPGSGATIWRHGLGVSQVKFWEVPRDTPTHVGSPYEMLGMSLVQFLVPDVDAVRSAVLARGGKIHTEPYRLGKGSTIMFVEGPDGVLFEFAGPLLDRLK